MRSLLAAVLVALGPHAAAADVPAAWRTWLEQVPAGTPAVAAIPSAAELEALRADRELLARWVLQPPSVTWNDIVQALVVKYQLNPLRASRGYAYMHVVIHDALVVCAQRGCDPAVRTVAMHGAASRMIEHLYPNESPGRFAALGRSGAAAVLANLGGHNQAELAWQAGSDVAAAAIRRALNDGWDMPKLTPKRPPWKPGVWQSAPPMNIYDPAEPHAPQWRTWVLKDGGEIEPPPPPVYDSPAFWAEVEEVRAVAAALTPAQKKIAEDWNLDAGSVTPPGVWNIHAKRLALEHKLDASSAARMFSTANVAMLDAFISCWHTKYKFWTERPVTVIRRSRDPNFLPHVLTPPFPSYTSGHSSVSGAGSEVLAAFFPRDAAELRRMAHEASMSRLYGGIHFRSDNEEGLKVGRRVGARALARLSPDAVAQRDVTTR
jgi:hypothetical protein